MLIQNRKMKTNREETMLVSDTPAVMTPQQVAEYLQVHIKTVYSWVNGGELKASKLGPRSFRVRKEDIESFLEERLFTPVAAAIQNEDESAIQDANQVVEKVAQNSKKIDTNLTKY